MRAKTGMALLVVVVALRCGRRERAAVIATTTSLEGSGGPDLVFYSSAEKPEYVPDPTAPAPPLFLETLRCEIKREYAEVATNPTKGFHFHTGRTLAALLGYSDDLLEAIPEESISRLAGTGNPFALGPLQSGETVVELGCGAGMDTLIASRMVGPNGRVISIDMTPEMLDEARDAASAVAATNIDFHLGY